MEILRNRYENLLNERFAYYLLEHYQEFQLNSKVSLLCKALYKLVKIYSGISCLCS